MSDPLPKRRFVAVHVTGGRDMAVYTVDTDAPVEMVWAAVRRRGLAQVADHLLEYTLADRLIAKHQRPKEEQR